MEVKGTGDRGQGRARGQGGQGNKEGQGGHVYFGNQVGDVYSGALPDAMSPVLCLHQAAGCPVQLCKHLRVANDEKKKGD